MLSINVDKKHFHTHFFEFTNLITAYVSICLPTFQYISLRIKEQHCQTEEQLYHQYNLYQKSNLILLNHAADVVSDVIYSVIAYMWLKQP